MLKRLVVVVAGVVCLCVVCVLCVLCVWCVAVGLCVYVTRFESTHGSVLKVHTGVF